jgi:hypothetical protein
LFFSFPLLFPPLTAIITVFLTGLRYDEEHVLHFFSFTFSSKKKKLFLLFLSWLLAVLWFRSSSFPFGSAGVAECWLPLQQLTRSCVPGEEEEEEEKKKYKQNTQKREREREREKTKDEKKKEANN